MIIAIDGPAASGKGTIGRLVAARYGFGHLDTGLLYRAVAAALLIERHPLDREAEAVACADRLPLADLDEGELGTPEIGDAASRVAVMPRLREALMVRQRDFAARPPGAVLVGRDIGTVICPAADAKIYLTAAAEVRAERRARQLGVTERMAIGTILEGIRDRDQRDITRPLAPLRRAAEARLLDTTDLDIEASFRGAIAIVDEAAGKTS